MGAVAVSALSETGVCSVCDRKVYVWPPWSVERTTGTSYATSPLLSYISLPIDECCMLLSSETTETVGRISVFEVPVAVGGGPGVGPGVAALGEDTDALFVVEIGLSSPFMAPLVVVVLMSISTDGYEV